MWKNSPVTSIIEVRINEFNIKYVKRHKIILSTYSINSKKLKIHLFSNIDSAIPRNSWIKHTSHGRILGSNTQGSPTEERCQPSIATDAVHTYSSRKTKKIQTVMNVVNPHRGFFTRQRYVHKKI